MSKRGKLKIAMRKQKVTKKQNYHGTTIQLEFDLNQHPVDEEEFDDIDLESLSAEELGFDGDTKDRTIKISKELLTLKLLRQAIYTENPDDRVMADFAEYVLPNLLRLTIGVTAKGGNFLTRLIAVVHPKGKIESGGIMQEISLSIRTYLMGYFLPI